MADRVSLKLGPVEKRLLMRIADALDRMAPPSPGEGKARLREPVVETSPTVWGKILEGGK